MTLQKD